MNNKILKNWKINFWFLIFTLLLIPIANSFIANSTKLINSFQVNSKRKEYLSNLESENEKLSRRVEYYKTLEGQKSLIKEKLNKVESGEMIIKFDK